MTTTNKRVIVFTTPTCTYCNAVKSYLRSNKIRFKEIDITKDEKAAKDMVRQTGQQGVPVLLINNKPIVGFDKTKINKLLEIK
jgi:glutaredoxin 3